MSNDDCDTVNMLFKYGLSSGDRAEATTTSSSTDKDFSRRINFELEVGDDRVEWTPHNMKRAVDGCFVIGMPGPTKCDRSTQEWGEKPMYFRKNSKDPLNFAHAWIEWKSSIRALQRSEARGPRLASVEARGLTRQPRFNPNSKTPSLVLSARRKRGIGPITRAV